MRITRRQSVIIAVSILGAFFLGTVMLVRSQRRPVIQPIDSATVTMQAQATPTPSSILSQVTPNPTGAQASTGEQQRFVLNKFHRAESKDGKKVWEVVADRGEYVPENNSVKLQNATLDLYRNDRPVSISAVDAVLLLEGTGIKEAQLNGNVRLVHDQKTTLTTEQAVYSQLTDTVSAPGEVSIDAPLLLITGIGLEGNLEKQQFRLLKNVATTIKPRNVEERTVKGKGRSE